MHTATPPAPTSTGTRLKSVAALLEHQKASPSLREKIDAARNETLVVHHLAMLRQDAGLTQEEMARALGVTQSAISKLENSRDDEITLGQLRAYAKAANKRFAVSFGKPMNHVEAVKYHAFEIRERLGALAEMANKYEEMQKDIAAFFGEAFFNILTFLGECHDQLPTQGSEEDGLGFSLCSNQTTSSAPKSSQHRGRKHNLVAGA